MNKTIFKGMLVGLLLGVSFASYSQIINTIAGNGAIGFSGDGGPATAAEIYDANRVHVDGSGNVYIADYRNERIRTVNTSGIIQTFAGNGTVGYSGDGGPATAAELSFPAGVTTDGFGNVYIADQGNCCVRKINTSGTISTFAGNGSCGYSGDGGPATAAEINQPYGVTIDISGNIYIADYFNARIRKINTSGIISTIAGNGIRSYSGDGGPATAAELNGPANITVGVSGSFYIADLSNFRIRVVNTSGIIETYAGNGTVGYSGDGGPASAAELSMPIDIMLNASGNLYIADMQNARIRMVNTSSNINTIAGSGAYGFSGDGGPATDAELELPEGVALDAYGNLYIADYNESRIRKVTGITTGINDKSLFSSEISIYPSPTSGSFTITGISRGQVIEVYNYLGQKVLSAISHQLSANFDISSMPNGIYLIRVQNKDGSVVAIRKIVKTGP